MPSGARDSRGARALALERTARTARTATSAASHGHTLGARYPPPGSALPFPSDQRLEYPLSKADEAQLERFEAGTPSLLELQY